jgi:hypothetical protein
VVLVVTVSCEKAGAENNKISKKFVQITIDKNVLFIIII